MQANKDNEGTAFGHAGIVAAASAVLADLEKGGVLKVPQLLLLVLSVLRVVWPGMLRPGVCPARSTQHC